MDFTVDVPRPTWTSGICLVCAAQEFTLEMRAPMLVGECSPFPNEPEEKPVFANLLDLAVEVETQ